MSQHPERNSATPVRPIPETATPMWPTDPLDRDLIEATNDSPTVEAWFEALASLGEATLQDNLDDHFYRQAPDALRQRSIDPTPETIEDWVREQRAAPA